MRYIILFACLIFSLNLSAQDKGSSYETALVNFEDYKNLMLEIESVRAKRLIGLDKFNKLASKRNTIVLDTRSKEKFAVGAAEMVKVCS